MKKAIEETIQRVTGNFQRKGQERLTIMIIPHGQDRMFSMQLNWSMIAFLIGTLGLAIFLAIVGVYKSQVQSDKYEELQTLYGNNFDAALNLEGSTNSVIQSNAELLDNLREISIILGVPQHELKIINELKPGNRSRSDLNRELQLQRETLPPGTSYLPPVFALRKARYIFNGQQALLGGMQESMEDGIGVYRRMPIGQPFNKTLNLRSTSGFGQRLDPFNRISREFHPGYDISGPRNTNIVSTGEGQVDRVFYHPGGYGRAVVVKHSFGYYSMYAHLAQAAVEEGETIRRGQLLGYMGSTGRSTGTHLHYEIWQGESTPINPRIFFCAEDFDRLGCYDFNLQTAGL